MNDLRTWLGCGNVLNLHVEIWTFVDNYTTLAGLRNIISLNLIVRHVGVVNWIELRDEERVIGLIWKIQEGRDT